MSLWFKMLKLSTLALVLCGGWIAARAADGPIPCDRRLSKKVVAYASIRNMTDARTQWSKTLFGQMLVDDALADFREDVVKKFAEMAQDLGEHLGLSLTELLQIPEGEVALAGVAGGEGGLHAVLFVDFGGHADDLHKLLDKHRESGEKNGMKFREEEVDEAKLISFQSPQGDDGDEGALADAGAYFIRDSFFVAGDDAQALKDVLHRWDGKHDETFAEHETYQYVLEKCRDEGSTSPPLVAWFVNPVGLVEAISAAHPDAVGQFGAAVTLFPTIGVDKFKGVGGVMELGAGDFDTVTRTLVVLERSAQGIGNLFQFDLSAQSPPKWLSADWTSYTAINWNVAKAYATIESLADMFVGPGTLAGQIQQLADNPATGNIHLKKDIIDQLAGTFHMASIEGTGGSKSAEGTLVAIQVKKSAAMRATLTKIAGLGIIKFKEREFQGETLYEIEVPGLGELDEDGEGGTLGLAVAEGHLLFASDVRLLERVLRGVGEGESLAESPAYKRIARRFPAKTASISFSRQDSNMKSVVEMLKNTPAGAATGLEGLDFSKLPDADLLKKFLPPTGTYMEQDARGLKITSFSLRNETD